jgi:hypothetical protein
MSIHLGAAHYDPARKQTMRRRVIRLLDRMAILTRVFWALMAAGFAFMAVTLLILAIKGKCK